MEMKSPGVSVAFRQAADRSISKSKHGVVALILRDAAANESAKTFVLASDKTVPAGVDQATQDAIRLAWLGGTEKPRQVLVYVMAQSATITAGCDALKWLATQHFDYLAGHPQMTTAEAKVLAAFVKEQREASRATCVAVVAGEKADSEAVVNFTAAEILGKDGKTYTAAQYCGRIAGLLAGTPDTMSATYTELPEVADVKRLDRAAQDKATAAGELLAIYDGEKVKLGRAVNSLTTAKPPKGEEWRKIRIVRIKDQVLSDIVRTAEDAYIGKVQNTYAAKLALVVAIRDYLGKMIQAGQLSHGTCDIDTVAQRQYLEDCKVPGVAEMDDEAVRKANTGSHVFLWLSFVPVDAMEDIHITVEMGGNQV